MGKLAQMFRSLRGAAREISFQSGDIYAISQVDKSEAEAIMQKGARELAPTLRSELAQSYDAAGIGTRTGTLRNATSNEVNVNPIKLGVVATMKQGQQYPNGRGNVYAAAGMFRYGGTHKGPGSVAKAAAASAAEPKKRKKKVKSTPKQAPKPGFFQLTPAGVLRLAEKAKEVIGDGLKALGISVG